VQGLQGGAITVDEQVHVPVAHVRPVSCGRVPGRLVCKTLAHVTRIRIQPVAHRFVQVKHGLGRPGGLMIATAPGRYLLEPAGSLRRDRQFRRLFRKQGDAFNLLG
jgi:hypothetical protein